MTALAAMFAFAMGTAGWFGGPFGGGPGCVSFEREGTNEYAHLVKERGPGATQAISREPAPIGAARRFEVSFMHRGADGAFRWRLERRNAKGRHEPVKNSAGHDFAEYVPFKGATNWTRHVQAVSVPKRLLDGENAVSMKFDVWGGNEPRALDVRDVRVEAVEEAPPAPPPPPVKIELEMSPKDGGFGPVPFLWKPNAAISDGLLLRDGKPFFWVGNGCDYGASQATPVGLWAAKLLGYTVVSLDPQGGLSLVKDDGTNATLRATANLSGVSHFREAARLGFYIDHFGNGVYKWSSLRKFAEAHPDFGEIHYDHGHYINMDTGHPLGLALQTAKREAYFRHVVDVPGVAEMELCREPGPAPSNLRAKRGFREWTRRKYGTLEEACRVWRRTYATWDNVLPMPLEECEARGYRARIALRRKEKSDFPEMHYDWIQYLQDDYTACVKAEREELRARFPELPVTIDVRGHAIENDAYCVLDPERIDPLMDLFSIHFGAHAYTYGSGMRYHLPALLDQTSFPFFSYNFFRTNTEKPIFNSEDIISKVRMPDVDAAAMEENDIAGHHALMGKDESVVRRRIPANGKARREERFGAKQYRMMLWPYLMQGTIGCWVWSWHDDYTRPYFPSLVKKLEVASEVVLPDLRHRRGEVAYLYGYLSGLGLPCTIVGNHADYLNWYDAIEFSGVRPDVFGERHFVKEIDPKRHRLLVVPFTKYVADETYAAFKRYVVEGGTAVVTDGSLERTFSRYRETDIRAFAGIDAAGGRKVTETRRGAGRVVYVAGHPEMEELMAIFKPYLPPAQIAVASAETREPPLIERVFAGSATRKVLYLANWGGCDHDLTVHIPDGFGDWRMTPLEGSFARDADGAFKVKVPSQDVAAILLEAPSVTARAETDIPPAWRAAVDRNAELNEERDTGKPKVLFPIHPKTLDPVGKELYPYVLDRVAAFGCEPKSVRIDEWTPELLAKYPLVVLPETNTKPFYRKSAKEWKPFRKMLADYVEGGGSLFFLVHTAYEVNNYGWLLEGATPEFGVSKRRETPRAERHSGFGDPGQVIGEAVAGSPLTEGVGKVQLYRMNTLGLKGGAKPVVTIPADAESCGGACAMAAVQVGKGRVFVSADAMAFQPFRINEADNAALLENVMGWLLDKPVTQDMRDAFKASLFLTEKTFQQARPPCRANLLRSDWVGRELHLVDRDVGASNSNLYWRVPDSVLKEVRGKALYFGGRVKQVDASGISAVSLFIAAHSKDGKTSRESVSATGVRGATPWLALWAKVQVPDDADVVRVAIRCAHGFWQTGEATFKDLILTTDPAELPPIVLPPPDELGHAERRLPDPHDTPEYAAYRATYRDMKPFEEDGRARPEIKNGTWYFNGRPTFFLGAWIYPRSIIDWGPGRNPLGIDHVAYTTPPGREVFAALGFNSSQISGAPFRPGEVLRGLPERKLRRLGKPSDWKADERDMAEYFARFGDVPMAMDFAFGYNKQYPSDLARDLNQYMDTWHAFIPFCPEHPEGWAYYRDYFLAGTRVALKNGMNAFLYELFNESSYNCQCPWNRRAFLDEARTRYGTIAEANATWRTDFDSFEEMVFAGDWSAYPGVWYDWCAFTARRYAAILRKGQETIRQVDRRHNVYFTEQAHGTPPAHPGMDYRLVADAVDVLTIEGGWQYGFKTAFKTKDAMEAVVATGGSKHYFNLAFFRALAKDVKPISNNEHYCTRFENGTRVPSKKTDYITSLWLEVMHGVSSDFTYVLDKRHYEARTMEQAYANVAKPSYKSSSLLNPFNVKPEDLDAFKTFRAELVPYEEKLLPMPRVRSASVAVYFSYPSMIQARHLLPGGGPKHVAFAQVTSDWYTGLLHRHYPLKIVFDEDVERLGDEVQALVFPGGCAAVPPQVVRAAEAFARRGGVVLAAEGTLACDEYLKPLDAPPAFARVATPSAAADVLDTRKVRRYAQLVPSDDPSRPLVSSDVQVVDRGDFKFVCCVNMGDRATRRATLRLFVAEKGGTFRLTDPLSQREIGTFTAQELATGVPIDLPSQERVLRVLDRIR